MTESKSYIEFKLLEEKPKTRIYIVLNKKSSSTLGIIKWFPNWRQYCFFPSDCTVFSQGCMAEINNFIQKLMKDRVTKDSRSNIYTEVI